MKEYDSTIKKMLRIRVFEYSGLWSVIKESILNCDNRLLSLYLHSDPEDIFEVHDRYLELEVSGIFDSDEIPLCVAFPRIFLDQKSHATYDINTWFGG